MIEEVVMQMVLMLVMCLLHYNQVKKLKISNRMFEKQLYE